MRVCVACCHPIYYGRQFTPYALLRIPHVRGRISWGYAEEGQLFNKHVVVYCMISAFVLVLTPHPEGRRHQVKHVD